MNLFLVSWAALDNRTLEVQPGIQVVSLKIRPIGICLVVKDLL